MKTKALKAVGVLVLLLVAFSVVYYLATGRPPWAKKILSGLRLSTDATRVYPYTPENSATLTRLLDTRMKYYQYTTLWGPKPWFAPPDPEKHPIKLYPFPIVENYDRKNLFKNRFDINRLPPVKQWERFGIQGVGVVTTLSIDRNDPKHLLIGTEGSGLYRSITFGNKWEKLKFDRNDITKTIIDPSNPKHYIVATGTYLFSDMPTKIYQSYDAGKTWDAGFIATFKPMQWAATEELLPDEIHFAGNVLTIFGRTKGIEKKKVIAQTILAKGMKPSFFVKEQIEAKGAGRMKIKDSGAGLASFFIETEVNYTGVKEKIFEDYLYKTTHYWDDSEVIYNPEDEGFKYYDMTAYDISNDGQRIAIFLRSTKEKHSVIVKSADGGESWDVVDIEKFIFDVYDNTWGFNKDGLWLDFTAQDLVLSDEDEDYIAVFIYMFGLLESFDGGKTFTQLVSAWQDVRYLADAEGETRAITPLDLRSDPLTPFQTGDDLNYLMPTDQGLFLYQAETATLVNKTKDLYLGDSGQVAVTSCPRVYAGLWHVGSYWVNNDNTIDGFNGGENWGYGAGADDECETPMFSPVHGYLFDGKQIQPGMTQWFRDNVDLGWPVEESFRYHDGWWYMYRWWGGEAAFWRINDDFNTLQKLHPMNDDSNIVRAYGWDVLDPESPLWVLDKDNDLWTMESDGTWEIVKNMGVGLAGTTRGIAVYDKRVILYALMGLGISLDEGITWKGTLFGKRIWALEQDKCGRIYVAVQPAPDSNYGGVFYSSNDGKTFSKLGTGDQRSYISSLAIDHEADILYAGTAGESILRMALDVCDQ